MIAGSGYTMGHRTPRRLSGGSQAERAPQIIWKMPPGSVRIHGFFDSHLSTYMLNVCGPLWNVACWTVFVGYHCVALQCLVSFYEPRHAGEGT